MKTNTSGTDAAHGPAVTSSRRTFISTLSLAGLVGHAHCAFAQSELSADIVIVGGGLGGCSAALAALRAGRRVIMTEETDWIGGQLTSQGVPPDEHRWIESHGANRSYRELRTRIRDYYRNHYPLVPAARDNALLNPGNGSVSRLCCEPTVALAVLEDWLAPYAASGQLQILREHRIQAADVDGKRVRAVTVQSLRSGESQVLSGDYFIDATELGDVLPLAGAEWITGAESRSQTNELHAAEKADPGNQQAFTMCFAAEHVAGGDHTIERPRDYSFWRDFVPQLTPPWPGKLLDLTYTQPRSGQPKELGFDPTGAPVGGTLNLWIYRRIIDRSLFEPGHFAGDISLINWPQNDYLLGNLIQDTHLATNHHAASSSAAGLTAREAALKVAEHIDRAKQLSLSLLYWLQTEVPRRDGGAGFPGLRLRPDLMGTEDGLAKMPYVRESRRIEAEFTILEEHVGREQLSQITGKPAAEVRAAQFADSVGVGSYSIDLHPSSRGDNYIDFQTASFQIPLGALLPVRLDNLLPACKNIGTTHLTSGCYRLHPVEWGIGEAAGALASFAIEQKCLPREVRSQLLPDFQRVLTDQGVEMSWPNP
ncbi:MAG: FAD-dependent oxidoreductase [Pirellulaceae bacterium]